LLRRDGDVLGVASVEDPTHAAHHGGDLLTDAEAAVARIVDHAGRRKIVDQHSGRIAVNTKKGEGTTVRILFPRITARCPPP
jgi:hypothetical protein